MKVYHGTSAHFYKDIESEGLIPQGHRTHSYVTTDYDKAKEYARYWTGGLLYDEQKALEYGDKDMFMMTDRGIVITLDIPNDLLKIDDYNLESELNQYKIVGGVERDYIIEIQEVTFPEFGEDVEEDEFQSNLLAASAKLVGVSQWGDD